MVKERSPYRTSSGQIHASSSQNLQSENRRQPLANIGAKMQVPSPKQPASNSEDECKAFPQKAQQADPSKPSLLLNSRKAQPTSVFMPKPKPVNKISTNPGMFLSSRAQEAQTTLPGERQDFYLPGQAPKLKPAVQQDPLALASEYGEQSRMPSSMAQPQSIYTPSNASWSAVEPREPPKFSSLGPHTYFRAFGVPPPPQGESNSSVRVSDNDSFDPDAELASQGSGFGAPDPYLYVDPAQANENIKNLLEGAFDDDNDKSHTRLRKRAKKALKEGNQSEAKSLANKLASLTVHQDEKLESKADEEVDEEEEDGTVEGLNVKLLPHQVEGVSWMIDKEVGVRKGRAVSPRGGILADDMGLGKTVQSVALILTNPHPGPSGKSEHPKQKLPGKDVSESTLVVAPLALIKQWEAEIKSKVELSHPLRVLVHHGPNRAKSSTELKKYDVVITTYQTLTSEHAGSNMAHPGGARIGCFGVYWYRIILDEAHSIKNRNAKSTLACCALQSWYRWCLTGTPMQNNLDELQSLIKFLQVKPYSELPNWKESIIQPMKTGRGGLAMRRLQVFLKAIMKRRTKDILKKDGALNFGGKVTNIDGSEAKTNGMKIVKREIVTVTCDFDQSERIFYNRLQARADRRLQEMMSKSGKKDYIGALVLLLRLRQACNHPYLIEMAVDKDKDAMSTDTGNHTKEPSVTNGEIDQLTALMGEVTVQTRTCEICQVELSASESQEGAMRCRDCEADLVMIKEKKSRLKSKNAEASVARKRYQLPQDSEDEGEGEWIAEGPEEHTDLGQAGGTDDEDAEGGGETLGSIDSERSVDEEDEYDDGRKDGRRRRPIKKKADNEADDENEGKESGEFNSEADISPDLVRKVPGEKRKHQPSTKIRKLLRILTAECPKHKTIVFSQFTSMLDLVEPHLQQAGLRFVRYDGSMRNDAREAALHSLRNQKSTRVLLCSLKCGSLGLNLTAASRVIILEPFWNPFVEEQAIDRVHRLNQTVDVKVYRLTIHDSVEERILELQEKKRELAKAAIEGDKAVGKLTMADIVRLFRHDAPEEHGEADKKFTGKFGGDMRLLENLP